MQIGRVEIVFDDDVNEDLINLHHHRTEAEVMTTLVRDARVEVRSGGAWREVARVERNRQRRWSADFEGPRPVDALRLIIENVTGTEAARVSAVRAYRA